MAFNFPDSPVEGDVYSPPGGPQYVWNDPVWNAVPAGGSGGVEEAPTDGLIYGRKDADWVEVADGSTAWVDITGKPATFPPSTHSHPTSEVTGLDTALAGKAPTVHTHAQGDVTNLVTDLAAKEPTITTGTTAQYWRGDKSWQTHDKASIGLGNVDNTSDASKPVSTAQAAADALNVLKAGDTMTGDLTITKAAPVLDLRKTAANESSVNFRTGTALRWKIISDSAAESAGTGSHFRITRHDDAGTQIDQPLVINRSTGAVTLGTSVGTNGTIQAKGATAIPAGGTSAFLLSSTGTFGVYFGSGAPTISAAKGSIYLRSDGADNNTRVYVNTNGTTGWTALNSIAVGTSAPGSPATNDLWVDTT